MLGQVIEHSVHHPTLYDYLLDRLRSLSADEVLTGAENFASFNVLLGSDTVHGEVVAC